jgi:signal peptidase I
MEPVIASPGFLVYAAAREYDVGDVVIFRSGDTYVVHRIINRTPEGFHTKGDGNAHTDHEEHGVVRASQILGRVRFVFSANGFGDPSVRP